MKTKNGLTISMIFKAESANYGEGYRNLTTLKKMTRGDFQEYSYISRQALRYDLIKILGWDNTPVEAQGNVNASVVQFAPSATIEQYPEIDLFGYMKTTSRKDANEKGGATKRSAVVRLSNAISLEPYQGDMDYLTNMGLASREGLNNAIAQSEIHQSYYGYTLSIDLDRVGIDESIEINNEEKESRIIHLLEGIEYLYRDIKGRRENLAPLFIIGGLYERKNPYFEHRINVKNNQIELSTIADLMQDKDIKENTYIGILSGIFANEISLKEQYQVATIHEVFGNIKKEVYEYYR